jgi:hypothetical protein
MKKFTLIVILLSLSIGIFAQSTPVSDIRVATATTPFGINLPIGTKVYNIADGKYWVAIAGVSGTLNLTTGSASFKQLNADGATFVTLDQTIGQTIGTTGSRLAYLWATNIDATNLTVTNPIAGSITGNAATVTTNANLIGPITSVGNTTSITDKAVILSKIADIGVGNIIGSSLTGTGAPEVIKIGTGLSFTGTTLNAIGLGGTVTSVSVAPANGITGSVTTPTTTPAITLTLGDITPTSVAATGTVSGTQFTSTNTSGAPFIVNSITPVVNLNIGGNATNVTGIVAVVNGGTGLPTLTTGSYMIGAGTANVAFKTPAQVLSDIGAAPAASASLFNVDSFEEVADVTTSGQTHTLSQLPKAGTALLVILNGAPLKVSVQYSVVGKVVTILIPVYKYDVFTISYGY